MSVWKISIPVQVYDAANRFIYAPGDSPSGSDSNTGQRITVAIEAPSAQTALLKLSLKLTGLFGGDST